ncbi:MAG: hypothetical protein ACUZ8E_18700 [Candidatus Anammoxibacter sp.]
MTTIKHVTLSELQKKFNSLHLPSHTRLTVTIEDDEIIKKTINKKNALEAMKKLKGSGNGNLVAALLKEREKDALYE